MSLLTLERRTGIPSGEVPRLREVARRTRILRAALAAGLVGDLEQPVFPAPLGRRDLPGGRTLDDGPVTFLYLPVAELLGEAPGGLGAAGEQHDPRDGPVEPMHNSQEDVAGFPMLFLQIGLHPLVERFLAPIGVRARRPRRLGNRQAVVVFEQDVERA